MKHFLFSFKTKKNFSIEIKNVAKTVYFHTQKKHFAAPNLKENKTFFVKKIRGFLDSEFVKICHEQVNINNQNTEKMFLFIFTICC